MKKLNIENITYFDNIDTEYKAYILGLIYADGTIDDKVKGNREWRLVISLQEEDGHVLHKLMQDCSNLKVRIYNPPSVQKQGWKKRAVASVSNTYLCKSLIELGCGPRKSQLGMQFPDLPEHLIHHFIRGFFDGDGCVTVNKKIYRGKRVISENFKLKLAFTSTDSEFLDAVMSYLPITKIYKREKLRSMLVHTYWIERKQDIQNVYEYLYKDANFYFTRKYEKFNMPIKSQVIGTPMKGLETT